VLTCRISTHEFKLEPFTEVEIADFDDQQIAVFVTKWFELKNPEHTESFLRKLQESPRIRELATNPLLLTLMCLNFEESGYFANSRAALYKDGLYVLLKNWDAKRHIERDHVYRQLTPDRKEDLLSQLAYQTFKQGQYIFSEEIAKRQISQYIANLPSADTNEKHLDIDSEAVLKSIEGQHGLLISRAHEIYSFSHLTFQEYFTARQIAASCSPYAEADEILQQLVQRVTDERWREVFLLVAEILPSADCFLQLLKQHTDDLVGQDQALQRFLGWTQEKAASTNTFYKPGALRAFYLYCSTPSFDRDSTLFFDSARDLGLAFVLAFNLGLARNRDLARDCDLAHDLALIRALARARALVFDRDLARDLVRDLAHDLDPEFCQILGDLKAQLPDPDRSFSAFKKWWTKHAPQWSEAFRNAAIQYRNIGHEWSFTSAQIELLQQYLEANLILVSCLKSNCYLSRNVRAEIEDTLLLPIAEIEARRVQ
jgi:predicted NACHT family NTPase